MVKTRKVPLRKSVVSNEIIDKRDLLRIVKNKEGQVFIDPTGKANGRGAYIKLDNEEAALAKKKKAFNRSFNGLGAKSRKTHFWRRTRDQSNPGRKSKISFSGKRCS